MAFGEVSQLSFCGKKREKKNIRKRGKKIEENKNSLYKYIEGWGTSFCCLSKLCLPIYCHVNSVIVCVLA